MKKLYEQAKDLAKDAEMITEKILSNENAVQLIEKLMYRYSALRVNLINKDKDDG